MRTTLKAAFGTIAAGLLTAGAPAYAADVYLQAQSFEAQLPWGESVPMWGYATCDAGWVNCTAPSDMSAAGPRIDVAVGDALAIHLKNTLLNPVSVLVPGQAGGGDPVFTTDGLGRRRVQSMTHEALPGGTADYTWPSLRAGTYLYQSGTQPSIQVPMGLVGALVVGPETGVGCVSGAAAYDDLKTCYDSDALLVFTELDPWLNAAIDAAAGDVTAYPSTVDYQPTYFLVNGEASAPMPAGAVGDTVLLRMVNAGLVSHVPSLVGPDLGLVAEDAFPYPGAARYQSSVLVAAGKTLDAVVTLPDEDTTLALFDRMPPGSSASQPDGGVAYLEVGAGADPTTPPTVYAVDDAFDLFEEQSILGDVLANDVGLAGGTVTLVHGPANGLVSLSADGTFSYSPNVDFAGTDSFTYSVNDGTNGYPALVVLTVMGNNDAPVAADDGPYVNTLGPDLAVAAPGVLGNDSDPDGDALTAVLDSAPSGGTLTLALDGSFTYTGGTPNTEVTFTYHADDGVSASDPVTVTLRLEPVANIALSVLDTSGVALRDFRWLVQEDAAYPVDPNHPAVNADSLATNFHKSYMPVLVQGNGAAMFADVALDPLRSYYVSVLPDDAGTGTGHSMSGAQIPPGATAVTVQVTPQPVPTAQVSVVVFEDNQPTNGVLDPAEPRLGGFEITLEDAGGRYGISGGTMSQDAFGNPLQNALDCFGGSPPPVGLILTCPDGSALIKNLPPGKYSTVVTPPAGGETWIQTSTIEGTRINDAWVMPAEPAFMVEFGAPGYHTFFGFVSPSRTVVPDDVPAADRSNTITGAITAFHDPRPPAAPGSFQTGSFDALAYTRAWVGLNSVAGDGPNWATVHAETDGTFTIPGIPDGTYQLVIWDDYLDLIIGFQTVTVSGADVNVGQIPMNVWFTRQEHNVYLDENQDGVRQESEVGLSDQVVNLRFRDGSVFQSFPTDTEGFVPFDEVFPFFNWQIAEIDFTRFKATGVTVTVDAGGDVTGGPYPGILNPQVGSPRTETGPVLLEAFQGFTGQTMLFDWGKAPYQPGENGGIAGIVYYASTRGENDPRLAVGDPWEAGLPGVKVRLYREVATDLVGGTSLALVEEVETDSWDAAVPTGCPGEDPASPYVTQVLGSANLDRCYDGWRNWNQARPGVFDGGYAFADIPPGTYVVEVVPPTGFELVKEEDKNVDFGDVWATAPISMLLPGGGSVTIMPDQAMVQAAAAPEPALNHPVCVGDGHLVPAELALFPGVETYAPFAGTERPLCDRKRVVLSDQSQAAADFHLFTSTPMAAQFTGLITDDIAAESNPASPGYGEKFSPAYMPFSMRDYSNHEVYRGYADAFGRYNGVVPSTFSANIPIPSGFSPAMYNTCLNDPGTGAVPDPLVNPNYGTGCYTLQFMPRVTSYLDTPVLPESAFAAGFNPVDCGSADATPTVTQVDGDGVGPLVASGGTLTLHARSVTAVPNPTYEGPWGTAPPTVNRATGFGTVQGTVTVAGTALTVTSWSDETITATVPTVNNGTGELEVIRGDNGHVTTDTVTVTIGTETPIRVHPGEGAIQAAIDAAAPGALILVDPGLYEESVIVWKPVRLQGAGAGTTTIDAVKRPSAKLVAWQDKITELLASGAIDLLDGQPAAFDLIGGGLFATERGAGVTVLAKNDGSFEANASRVDGFTITGSESGGGVFVNAYAHNLEISNNLVTRNSGGVSGGVRVGSPFLPTTGEGPFGYNTNVQIHHNTITLNGANGAQPAGGGVAIFTGTDDYRVDHNFVCGNYTAGDGAGIGHLGLSDNGVIRSNTILFNQSFDPSQNRSGGGIFVGGEPGTPPALTLGAGDVTIDANLIQGNMAGAGHGGGIRAEYFNGHDVELSPDDVAGWFALSITNNIIVNNVAGWAGGGVSLQDAPNTSIVLNTIVNNDSTATVGALFDAVTGTSTAQPAGVSSAAHSAELDALIPDTLATKKGFSNPTLTHDILWHNRSFSYEVTATGGHLVPDLNPNKTGACRIGATFWDLGVLDPDYALTPLYSIVSVFSGVLNTTLNPKIANAYCNGSRSLSVTDPIQVTGSAGEGGNFLDVRYGPLTRVWPADGTVQPWDYHLLAGSPAMEWTPPGVRKNKYIVDVLRKVAPAYTGVAKDFDRANRTDLPDLGADEIGGTPVVHGSCSQNSTNAGQACLVNTDCLPNTGPLFLRGICVY